MAKIPLTFPAFYQCVVKPNTNLHQYDAVSVLLLGERREELGKIQEKESHSNYSPSFDISDADAANYTSGKKPIKREILKEVSNITPKEAARRLHKLGFQDAEKISKALRRLLDISELSPQSRYKLLTTDPDEEFSLAANVFLHSLKYPSKQLTPLSPDDKKTIALCYTNEPLEGSSDQQEPHVMTQAEIKQILQGMDQTQNESSQKVPQPDQMRNNTFSSVLYMSEWEKDVITEFVNIVLSSGISSLANLFEEKIPAGSPSFFFANNCDNLIHVLSEEENTKIIYRFYSEEFFSERLNQNTSVCGYVIVSTERTFLNNFYEQQMKKYQVRYFSYSEYMDYKASVYREIGSIFCGACVSRLADYLDSLVMINETNTLHIDESNLAKGPLFIGMLPFYLPDVHGLAHIILEYEPAQVLLAEHRGFFHN